MPQAVAPELSFTTDPAAFLAEAGEHLAAEPVVASVVATVTRQAAADDTAGLPLPEHPRWWAVARDGGGTVVGAAMRTAPFQPHPLYVLPMPDDAARLLARRLHERGERLAAVNGALPAARVVAEEAAALVGREAVVDEHLLLWQLTTPDDLVDHDAPGRLRLAEERDVPVCSRWFGVFDVEAAEQAGRSAGTAVAATDEEAVARRVRRGLVWLWESPDGEVVHLTAQSEPAYGAVRIGPVLTARERRGHGYASAAVAQVTRKVLEAGHRACLYTDLANPTSNRIYAAIGYRPLAETANLLVR